MQIDRHRIALDFISLSFPFYFHGDVNRCKVSCVYLTLVAATYGAPSRIFYIQQQRLARSEEEKEKKEKKKKKAKERRSTRGESSTVVHCICKTRNERATLEVTFQTAKRSTVSMSFRRSSTRTKPPKATIKILCVGDGSIGEYLKSAFLSYPLQLISSILLRKNVFVNCLCDE